MPTLDELRQRLNEIDAKLIELIAERQEKSREIARVKRATGHATRDYAREREVILGAREAAARQGVSPAGRRDPDAHADPQLARRPRSRPASRPPAPARAAARW
jgi:hypothetical protein